MEEKGKTVLLVDDEEKFLRSISERIRLMGFKPNEIHPSSHQDILAVAQTLVSIEQVLHFPVTVRSLVRDGNRQGFPHTEEMFRR